MNRFLCSAAVCALALAPLSALAASPSPSPDLATVLAPAPSGFAELTTASLHGEFTAHDWAVNASGASPQETETTLNRFGFVDGYGKEWSSASLRRGLVEAVMAFNGGSGAKKALTALESTDKADTHYSRADTITGIDTYYGAHFTPSGAFEDEFVFVKGNDLFIVIVAGAQDTVLTPATEDPERLWARLRRRSHPPDRRRRRDHRGRGGSDPAAAAPARYGRRHIRPAVDVRNRRGPDVARWQLLVGRAGVERRRPRSSAVRAAVERWLTLVGWEDVAACSAGAAWLTASL